MANSNGKQQNVRAQTEVLWQTVGHPHLTFPAKHIIHDPMFVFVLWAVLSEWQSSMYACMYVCRLPLDTCVGAIFLQTVLNIQVKQTMYEISGYGWHKCFGAARHDCVRRMYVNPLNAELNPICYLLVLLGAHHFLHVSRIRVKLLTLRRLMSYIYIYRAPILDVSRSHTTTHHSR